MYTFADDTTLVGLITKDDHDVAYRNEVLTLVEWCSHHNLELNVLKIKEMVVDFRRKGVVSQPLSINGVEVV